MTNRKNNRHFIASWSGGKDSCFAFYCALQEGLTPGYLLNMVTNSPIPSLKKKFVCEQAKAINIPIFVKNTTWDNYEKDYIDALKKIIRVAKVDTCVFGDIDIEEHRRWNEETCKLTSLMSFNPLWQKNRQKLLLEFISLGFKATINVVDTQYLDESFLGREINISLIKALEKENIDICGENGEYHTIVTNGPIFSYPLRIQKSGIIENNQYCYLDFSLEKNL